MWFAHMILDQFLWSEKLLIWNARLYEGWVSLRIFMGWIPKRIIITLRRSICQWQNLFLLCRRLGTCTGTLGSTSGARVPNDVKGKFRLRKMPWCYPLVNKDSYWKWPFIVMLVYQMVKWGNYNSLQCFVPYDMLLPQWKISPALDALDFFSRRRGQPYLPWSAVKWDSLVILVIPPKLGISN